MSREPFRADDDATPSSHEDTACEAPGCPNRWTSSVDAGLGIGRRNLCRAHGAVPPRLWSLVTNAQLRERAEALPAELTREPLDPEAVAREKARLAALRDELAARTVPITHAWAHKLRDRERRGAVLLKSQRRAWRDVLGEDKAP